MSVLSALLGSSRPANGRSPSGWVSCRLRTGEAELHVVSGGSGVPLLLVPGWPQTWQVWRYVMPALADAGFTVVAIEPKGLGDSVGPPSDDAGTGYDTGSIARELVAAMAELGHQRFAVIGHDIGAWVGYAIAADLPEAILGVVLIDALIPGLSAGPKLLGPSAAIVRSWHFAFNRAPWSIQEPMLANGGGDAYLAWQFRTKAAHADAIEPAALADYLRANTQPDRMRTGLNHYRALDTTVAQNAMRAKRPLTRPILAIGGESGVQSALENALRPVAPALTGRVLPGCGHYVPEEAPDALLAAVLPFLADATSASTMRV